LHDVGHVAWEVKLQVNEWQQVVVYTHRRIRSYITEAYRHVSIGNEANSHITTSPLRQQPRRSMFTENPNSVYKSSFKVTSSRQHQTPSSKPISRLKYPLQSAQPLHVIQFHTLPCNCTTTSTTMYLTMLPLLALTSLALAAPFEQTCATVNSSAMACAELYNTTDCSGPATLLISISPRPFCFNFWVEGSGSINVRKGASYAAFSWADCKNEPDFLTGPRWKAVPQGCEGFKRTGMVESWNALP
jgi:hypothetical protein